MANEVPPYIVEDRLMLSRVAGDRSEYNHNIESSLSNDHTTRGVD